MRHLKKSLAGHLASKGLAPLEASRLSESALAFLSAIGAIPPVRLAIMERDAQIYKLRGQRIECSSITKAYGISRGSIYVAVRRHLRRLRGGNGE